jgi:hypothetical protein
MTRSRSSKTFVLPAAKAITAMGRPPHDDRDVDCRPDPKPQHHRGQLLVDLFGNKPLWSPLGLQLRASRGQYPVVRGNLSESATTLQVSYRREQLRVRGVHQLETRFALPIPEIDQDNIGKGGDGHLSDGEQGLLRIERFRQKARGIGEHRHGLLSLFLLRDVASDFGETT